MKTFIYLNFFLFSVLKLFASESPFKILITDLEGVTQVLETSLSSSIRDLKEQIYQCEKFQEVPPELQRLIFVGRELKDDETIENTGAQQESSFHLVYLKPIKLSFKAHEASSQIFFPSFDLEALPLDNFKKLAQAVRSKISLHESLALQFLNKGQKLSDPEKTLDDYKIKAGETLQVEISAPPDHKHYQVVLCGASQAGKTSLLASLMKESSYAFKIGDGSRKSVTLFPQSYTKLFLQEGITVTFTDTPGLLSTRQESSETLLKYIEFDLLERQKEQEGIDQIDAFILTESLCSDAEQLTYLLRKLIGKFGEKIIDSILVIGTKQIASQFTNPRSLESTKKACKELGLPFLAFETMAFHPQREIISNSEASHTLLEMIQSSKPFALKETEDLKRRIEARAQELMKKEEAQFITRRKQIRTKALTSTAKARSCFPSSCWGRKPQQFPHLKKQQEEEIEVIEVPKDIEKFRRIAWKEKKELLKRTLLRESQLQ